LASLISSNTGKQKEFDKILLESIEDCLKQVFGESTGKAILAFLEKNQCFKREEIPRRVEDFSTGLSQLMGRAAPVLKGLIVKFLCFKLGLEYDGKQELKFVDYIQALRNRFEEVEG